MSGLLGNYLGQETVRAVCRGIPRRNAGRNGAGGGGSAGGAEHLEGMGGDGEGEGVSAGGGGSDAGDVPAARAAKVDERGLTPAMRELLESKPQTPSPLPALDFIVGSRIELCDLTGTERNWNGRRGVVTAKHLSMHPQNKNVRAWVLEIAFDKPISKTTFFSDHCRLIGPNEPGGSRKQRKKVKPNAPCPCGSGKKFKKCCGGKNAKKTATSSISGGVGLAAGGVPSYFGSAAGAAAVAATLADTIDLSTFSFDPFEPPVSTKDRPKLRFAVGEKVQAFAGAGEWINGTIIKLWDQGNPYRIELDDGTNVWGPEDVSNFVRPRNISRDLRFKVGDRVLANALGGWKNGKIIRVWDHGNPYRIELDDGTNVWGPEDVDKFVRPLAEGVDREYD
jgi:hypothetical protein